MDSSLPLSTCEKFEWQTTASHRLTNQNDAENSPLQRLHPAQLEKRLIKPGARPTETELEKRSKCIKGIRHWTQRGLDMITSEAWESCRPNNKMNCAGDWKATLLKKSICCIDKTRKRYNQQLQQ